MDSALLEKERGDASNETAVLKFKRRRDSRLKEKKLKVTRPAGFLTLKSPKEMAIWKVMSNL